MLKFQLVTTRALLPFTTSRTKKIIHILVVLRVNKSM